MNFYKSRNFYRKPLLINSLHITVSFINRGTDIRIQSRSVSKNPKDVTQKYLKKLE